MFLPEQSVRACADVAQGVQNQLVRRVARDTSHVTRHTSQVTHSVANSLQTDLSSALPPLPEFIDRFATASTSASASASASASRPRLIKIPALAPATPSLNARTRGSSVRSKYFHLSPISRIQQARIDHLLLHEAAASALKRAKLAM
jgi:hypothetical protein